MSQQAKAGGMGAYVVPLGVVGVAIVVALFAGLFSPAAGLALFAVGLLAAVAVATFVGG